MSTNVDQFANSINIISSNTSNHCLPSCSDKSVRSMNFITNIALKTFHFATYHPVAQCVVNTIAFSYFGNLSLSKSFTLSAICYIGGTIPMATRLIILPTIQMLRAKESPGSRVVQITEETFNNEILDSNIPVVLDAYSSCCAPCIQIASTFSELSQKMEGKVKFAKFDIEEERSLSKEFKIKGTPTLLFFKDGKVVGRHLGLLTEYEILLVLDTLSLGKKLD